MEQPNPSSSPIPVDVKQADSPALDESSEVAFYLALLIKTKKEAASAVQQDSALVVKMMLILTVWLLPKPKSKTVWTSWPC